MIPDDAMHPTCAAVLAAVHHAHESEARCTVRDICDDIGGMSTSTVFAHLRTLERAGLVTWQVGRRGTLRPTFTVLDPSKATVYR